MGIQQLILGARFDDGAGGDNEVQRTMLELINQLDGFDPRGNIKVLMATNRPDTLDPALIRPGRLDRKIEFGLPDLDGRKHIFTIHARSMSVEKDIRYELLARLCPNSTGTYHLTAYSQWRHIANSLISPCYIRASIDERFYTALL